MAIKDGAAQVWQTNMLRANKPPAGQGEKDEGMAAGMNKQMLYFMPDITVFFGYQFPAGLTLYWMSSTLFSVGQQYYIFKKDGQPKNKENTVIEINENKKEGNN